MIEIAEEEGQIAGIETGTTEMAMAMEMIVAMAIVTVVVLVAVVEVVVIIVVVVITIVWVAGAVGVLTIWIESTTEAMAEPVNMMGTQENVAALIGKTCYNFTLFCFVVFLVFSKPFKFKITKTLT